MRTILVTGAAGFIGSNFVRMLLGREDARDVKLVVLDKLTYAGNLANIQDLLDRFGPSAATKVSRATNPKTGEVIEVPYRQRLHFVRADICDADAVGRVWDEHGVREVVHFAAESHVDR